jgi:hypothetical protein
VAGFPGYTIIYTYDTGLVEERWFDDAGEYKTGAVLDSWQVEPTKSAGVEGDTAAERRELELERQRKKNAALENDPAYETDAERLQRARQTISDQGAAHQRDQAEAQRKDTQVVSTRYEADGTKVETYASGRVERTAPSPSEVRSAATANRPTMISPGSTRRNITFLGPEGLSTQDNPEFDQAAYDRAEAQATAKAERDRLSLMIQAGQLSEQTAATQYKRWFDENVTVPLQRAQEARARATELRVAQEAEDKRQQFAADYEKSRQTTALSAGQQAASAFNTNLQYQVGPAFGEQFAGALNSLRGGPAQQFTADAFTFKGPAIEEVARKATAQALSTISPYAKAISTAGNRPLQVAEYDPSMTPAAMGGATGGPPPPAAAPPDYQGLVNQYLQNNPYQPGGAAPPEEEETE